MSTLVGKELSVPAMSAEGDRYQPALWEKICVVVAAFSALTVIGYLLIEKGELSHTKAGLAHVLASLAAAVLTATLPGYLDIGSLE